MPKRIRRATRESKTERKAYVIVLTTCGSLRGANRIARAVISARLAACVNVMSSPVRSIYRWKGKIEQANEFLLLIKTSQAKLEALEAEVLRLHSYDVPEFLVIPVVSGSPDYLAWIESSLREP